MFLLIAAGILASIFAAAVLYARWNYGKLESTGIPVETPGFLLGSSGDVHKHVLHEKDLERFKKHGPVFGFYEGRAPHVYIADPDLVREILVKDFDHFRNRRQLDFGHALINEMLDVLPDEKWRTLRASMSPQFTTGKIRLMSEKIKDAAMDCVALVDKECKDEKMFDIKQLYTALTTDVIARCAFGTKLMDPHDRENEFVKMVTKLTGDQDDPNWMVGWVFAFPFLIKGVPLLPPEALEFFNSVLRKILDSRRKTNQRENDFVDCLNDLIDKTGGDQFKNLGITDTTIMCQSILFLLAGFDTTATTLTMLSYRLARNPEKQEKLIKELDAAYEKHGGIDHDTIMELPYLNACIQEALRMCPPLIRLERECTKDWKHPSANWGIKKGTTVQMSTWAINYNEKCWPEPHQYIPERFMLENKEKNNPYAFLTFGQGPRNCIGMRFAKEEINLVVARMLRDFRFEATEETKVQFKPGRAFLVQYEPVMLKVVRRIRK